MRGYLVDEAFELLDDQIPLEDFGGDWETEIAWDENGFIVGLTPEGWEPHDPGDEDQPDQDAS